MVTILTGFAIAVGVVGTLLPVVPGLGLIWAATVVYGLVEGFGVTGWILVGIVLAVRIPQRAAAAGGIGFRGQLLAFGLAAVGFFVIPVVGAAVGFVAGVYLSARRVPGNPWTTTRRTVRALVAAAAAQFATGVGMALTWLAWVVLG
jgi:uncharacterized protein YqgC (DUF456 family)